MFYPNWSVMRQSAGWMSIWDDRLLEILYNEGPMSVGALSEHPAIGIAQSSVSRRMAKIADHNLATPLGNGVYQISEEGKAYLHEEYDAEKGRYIENVVSETDTHDTEINETGANGA